MPNFEAIAKQITSSLYAEGKVSPADAPAVQAAIEKELAKEWAATCVTHMARSQVARGLGSVHRAWSRTIAVIAREAAHAGRD